MADISDSVELRMRVQRINEDLQDIQNYLNAEKNKLGKIKFPHGFIRTAATCRATLPNLQNSVLMENISYTIIMTDVLRWLIIRTNITGVAKNMIIKMAICLLASVVEAITKRASEILNKTKITGKYEARLKMLLDKKIISKETKNTLEKAWIIRNKIHIPCEGENELSGYETHDYNNTLRAYHELSENLKQHI